MSIPIGITLRNMGTQSTPELLAHCAAKAEAAGLHSIWVVDHIAIPPDDAEGSGGRYLDPLATLAWLGAQTRKIMLGTAILVLPYRPALPTAKWIATLQELTGERLILGTGIGWMKPEFDALGVPLKDRAKISEETLQFLNDAFANDVVTANGQDFLFKPRPKKPPILIGGDHPHATDRAVRLCDGWFPMRNDPAKLAPQINAYKDAAAAAGKPASVTTFARVDDPDDFRDKVKALEDAGVDMLVASVPYDTADEFSAGLQTMMDALG
ncbi:MAG: TIGR03619 family F420-dependent LLM class oxidoreductase [Alphaproteobacteria bacterium]